SPVMRPRIACSRCSPARMAAPSPTPSATCRARRSPRCSCGSRRARRRRPCARRSGRRSTASPSAACHGPPRRPRPRRRAPPPAEPVSSHAQPPGGAEEAAALAADSIQLIKEPEFRAWGPAPEAAAPYVEEVDAIRQSPIVLTPLQQQERLREVLARAAAALYPPATLARRLAGTAYVLAETRRPAAARLALAVAAAVREAPARAHEVPFVAAPVGAGVGGLVGFPGPERG